jgi:hypothetical protein
MKYRSVTPPSKMLRKYLGISVRPMAAKVMQRWKRGQPGQGRPTVSLGAILQAEGQGHGGIILKELRRERIPPEVVALLQRAAYCIHILMQITIYFCSLLKSLVDFMNSIIRLAHEWSVASANNIANIDHSFMMISGLSHIMPGGSLWSIMWGGMCIGMRGEPWCGPIGCMGMAMGCPPGWGGMGPPPWGMRGGPEGAGLGPRRVASRLVTVVTKEEAARGGCGRNHWHILQRRENLK